MGQALKVDVAGSEMGLYEERPKGVARGAVIVIQEAFGVTDHIQDVCRRFAAEGFVAVAPHIFHRSGDPTIAYDKMQEVIPHVMQVKAEGLEADIDATLAYLKSAGFEPKQVGIVGFCLGGSVAALIAERQPLGAAVTYYGGGISQGRFGAAPLTELAPKFKTPWLGLYGDVDQSIPFTEVEMLRRAAKKAPVPTDVVRYSDADHGFNCDARPTAYHEASAKDAWGRTIQWLAAHLAAG
jgi:carboxymethylenebutenolidase